MAIMTRADIIAFATRDWRFIEDEKRRFWVRRKRDLTPADLLRLGDDLRCHARAMRPDWPDSAARVADWDAHQRVSEGLRAVTRLRLG